MLAEEETVAGVGLTESRDSSSFCEIGSFDTNLNCRQEKMKFFGTPNGRHMNESARGMAPRFSNFVQRLEEDVVTYVSPSVIRKGMDDFMLIQRSRDRLIP